MFDLNERKHGAFDDLTISSRGLSPLLDKVDAHAADPNLVNKFLNNDSAALTFFQKLFETNEQDLDLLSNGLILKFKLQQVLPESVVKLEKNVIQIKNDTEIAKQYAYLPNLKNFSDYLKVVAGKQVPDPNSTALLEYFVFLAPTVHELFQNSSWWQHPRKKISNAGADAPSYTPFQQGAAASADLFSRKRKPICLPSNFELPGTRSAADLAIALAPIAEAYLEYSSSTRQNLVTPFGCLCFFDQIFGSGADNDTSQKGPREPIIPQHHILPMACLAWHAIQKSEAAGSKLTPFPADPKTFRAPLRPTGTPPSTEVLTSLGSQFELKYGDDTVQKQFSRLSTAPEFSSTEKMLEVVRLLCPLVIAGKKDPSVCLIKPLCYLELRQSDSAARSDGLYLQGHVVWSRAQESGEQTIFTVRFHTIHRADSDRHCTHPTMRITRVIPGQDETSPVGHWQYLMNEKRYDILKDSAAKAHIIEDASGNRWIQGTYVEKMDNDIILKVNDEPIREDGRQIKMLHALQDATHFSFVKESWLEAEESASAP